MVVDEYLHPFSTLCVGIADLDAELVHDDFGVAMRLEQAKVDLPIELDVYTTPDGRVEIASSPPTQQIETTYMPVFHRIRLTVTADERA
jgi:hypothetical protein